MSSLSPIPVDHGLTAESLRTLYRLDKNGVLWFRWRPMSMFADGKRFSAEHDWKIWNIKWANKEVNPGASKYKKTPVPCPDGIRRQIKVHNIIECMRTDEWPKHIMDHINGDTLDNRPDNHRPVTESQSAINRGMFKNNKSGVIGVWWCDERHEWWAYIKKDGKTIRLYRGPSKQDAIAARKAAELKYHGKYRRKQLK